MSEGVWINVFMVFCGMWMALIFVLIGVVISDYRHIKDVLHRDHNIQPGVCDRCRTRDINNDREDRG